MKLVIFFFLLGVSILWKLIFFGDECMFVEKRMLILVKEVIKCIMK